MTRMRVRPKWFYAISGEALLRPRWTFGAHEGWCGVNNRLILLRWRACTSMLREDEVYARGMAGYSRNRPGADDRNLYNAGRHETYREGILLVYSASSSPSSGSNSNPITDRRRRNDFSNLRGVKSLASASLSHWSAFAMKSARSSGSSMSYFPLNGGSSGGLP